MLINRIVTLLTALKPATVQAHCDTAEGVDADVVVAGGELLHGG